MSGTGTKQVEEPKLEDHLFEEETKLEASGVSLRLIGIIAIVVAIGAGLAYFFISQQKDLTAQQAAPVLTAALKAKGPAVVHFHAGHVVSSVDEKPRDPHYKLLEKAGIVKVSDDKKGGSNVSVTADGERMVSALPEFKKWKNTDGTFAYSVPLATRELVQVNSVTMRGPNGANVTFDWKWAPNALGAKFDAAGPLVKTFNTWDRATLIKSYGVDFYSDTKKGSVYMVRTGKGWKITDPEY